MSTIRVGVLRGGPSHEYEVSLKTGGNVLKHLPSKYQPVDIFVDKKGAWHLHGAERTPEKILKHVDVVFNALHGTYGEDGKVQRLLDMFSIPYTGSRPVASALGMNKMLSKDVFLSHGMKVPQHVVINQDDHVEHKLAYVFPDGVKVFMVKPVASGSSLGVSVVTDMDGLLKAILDALQFSHAVLIEEYINGREVTCGVVESAENKNVYALAPIEIVPPNGSSFFDYQTKSDDSLYKTNVSNFTESEKREIQELAIKAHQSLGLRHYSRSDFIMAEDGGIYVLEANSLPGLAPEAIFQNSLIHVGSTFPEFLDHVLALALNR